MTNDLSRRKFLEKVGLGTAAGVGMLDHNIQVARNFTAFPESDMDRLRKALGPSRGGLEKNLLGHHDGPTSKQQLFLV